MRVAPEGDPVVWLEGGAIEVYGGWLGWDLDALIDNAEIIDGLPFARLKDVLAFKRSLVLQCHLALPGSAASVLGILQRSLVIFATH